MIDGRNDSDNSFRSVVQVNSPETCTGVLIAPNIVLAAAHCIQFPGTSSNQNLTDCGGAGSATRNWVPLNQWFDISRSFPGVGLDQNITIGFGNNSRSIRQIAVDQFMNPGRADIVALRLRNPVSSNVARPMKVLTRDPNDLSFWASQRFTMVGWGPTTNGGTVGFRQVGNATNGMIQQHKIRVNGNMILGGDSGSPLIWSDGGGIQYVVGMCQGQEPSGGRYTVTFFRGGPDESGRLRCPRPDIGAFVERVLSRNIRFRTTVRERTTECWSVHSFPENLPVNWTIVPSSPISQSPQIKWSVSTERQSEELVAYHICVTNVSREPVTIEARYDVLN